MSEKVKSLTFVSVDNIALSATGESEYIADVKKLGTVQVVDVVNIKKSAEKLHSDINNQPGRRFISVQGSTKVYARVGYNVFAKSVISCGGVKKIAVLAEKKIQLEDILRSSHMRLAFTRQKDFNSEVK